ncbi:hypothetical protein JHK86_043344 [Glycine max]|nr:hypothetical protein JHK86_043344 [Glycine max]
MVCCWLENPNSQAFKRHISRIKDDLWVAEDGMKMQRKFGREKRILGHKLVKNERTPYTAGKPTLSSLEPTEPPTLPENPYCHRSNPIEPTLSWVEENPRYRVATRVLKQSSVLKGQSFLREILRLARDLGDFLLVGIHRDQTVS